MFNLNESIGKRVAELRHAKGISQEELAKRLNCTPKHISHVERGVASLSLDLMIEASEVLGTTLDYLIKGTKAPAVAQFPPNILKIMDSKEEGMAEEKERLRTYLNMYGYLRNDTDPGKNCESKK